MFIVVATTIERINLSVGWEDVILIFVTWNMMHIIRTDLIINLGFLLSLVILSKVVITYALIKDLDNCFLRRDYYF